MARDLFPYGDPDEDDRPLAAHAACDPVRAMMLAEEHADLDEDDDWECDDDEMDDFEDEDEDFEEEWDDEEEFDDDDFEDDDFEDEDE